MRTIQRVNSSLSNSSSSTNPLSTSLSSNAVNFYKASSSKQQLNEEEQLTVCLHLDPSEEPFCSTVEVIPGQSLIDSLTPFLTQNGVAPIHVEIFLENSRTPVPTLSEARFLVGQRLNVKLKSQKESPPATISKMDTKASRSIDEQEFRTYDESDAAKIYYMEKAGSSRNLLGPIPFYEGSNNFTVPRRKGSLNVDPTSSGLNSPVSIDDRFYGPGELYAVPSLSGSLNGTRRLRAPSTTRRSTLFGGKMEKFTTLLDRLYRPVEETSLLNSPNYEIEKHYSDLVKSRKIEHNDVRKNQEAIWEMVTTEHRYMKFLDNMCHLHKTLLEVQQRGFLHEIDSQMVFLNFSDLFRASIEFWHRGILPMIKHSRQTGECLNALLMRDAFESICEWSRCYLDFNINYNNSHSYIQKKMKDSESFSDFVRWIESKSFMNRQRLIDILTAPVQHLTRYPLMLRSVVHSTQHKEEKLQIQIMLDKADEANMTLNHFLSNNDILIQLIEIMKTIESYDAVDQDEYTKLVPPYVPPFINLTQPMKYGLSHTLRRVFTRGDLKLKESRTAPKVEVHCILFTDMLLICKFTSRRADRFRIYKSPLVLCRCKTIPFTEGNGFYLVSFDRFESPSNFYMFYTINQEESKRWIELIEIAQSEYTKLTNDPENTLNGFSQKKFLYRGQEVVPMHYPPETLAFYHRKSHSMDSQALAHAHQIAANGLRREAEIASAEQLDRRGYDQHPPLPHHPNTNLNRPQKILVDDDPTLEKTTLEEHFHLNSEDKESLDSTRTADEPSMTPPTEESSCGRTSSAGRRFEKRYHTVGEVDQMKSTPMNPINQSTILKRFSWNVGSQKKISRLSDKLQITKPSLQHSRRFSQSTTDDSSFGSSTSGISTSSSHDISLQNGSNDASPNCHISRVRIEEQMEQQQNQSGCTTIGSPTSTTTLTTNCMSPITKHDSLKIELNELVFVEKPPPLPHFPPPETDQSCSSDDHEENRNLMQQPDLLKLILNDELEHSIV